MSPISVPHRILVVDDEALVRELFIRLLQEEGYEVATADNGFDGLLKLKHFLPAVIISDLNMPKMSGFEFLSVVRRRFPNISVIASSGAYASNTVPTGVLADAFYAKGEDHPETLISSVAALIATSAAQATAHQDATAPVLDSKEWKRLKRNTVHRDHLYGVPALISAQCRPRGERGGSRNSMSVLFEHSQVHH